MSGAWLVPWLSGACSGNAHAGAAPTASTAVATAILRKILVFPPFSIRFREAPPHPLKGAATTEVRQVALATHDPAPSRTPGNLGHRAAFQQVR